MSATVIPSTSTDKPLKIAVVGCGVAGLTAAWLLSRKHEVHLFEKNDYAGGHTRTLRIADGPDEGTAVDTGFIVMNHRNYPHFTEVLKQLGVALADSSMTFSYYDRVSDYGYSGNTLGSLFPKPSYFFNGQHLSLMKDLWRFARIGYRDLNSGYLEGKTLGEYFSKRRFSGAFLNNYLYPMGAAIWSSPVAQMSAFPAQPYLHFLENHGLLRLTNRPQWKYVAGGSRTYVEAMLKQFERPPQLSRPPESIRRTDSGVVLEMPDGESLSFDHVVIGAHADEALKLLADPTSSEKERLEPWHYQPNTVVLHTSHTHLPPDRKQWSSWNFIRESSHDATQPVSVSYYMNRLQNLKTHRDYVVTLNATESIPESTIINSTTLTHPLYSFESMATQPKLEAMNGERNTWFCGSYFGYGFHEDAVRSAVQVAKGFGIEL
ncbi:MULTISPECIES: NAD(P)/FAD-dependent oxidoreductase [unclassified Lentimonas]|uniref:NAD(P)/FAD-dependent oxidoreductase n=1 Tax=unclassified Lentimonas TaxID=2630993 RepID=UPI00132B3E78|nr:MULTISPECIES: FAD-dependent oxidoreductase [unclassified Lentimonas]CAA6676669.1 COG2907: Amine oxidase, flavin-containing [Lentimonas sp. CC4]CAA6684667.1 COG2907: Amine oxidase, flavin-containing [Lentimonas sp. CC6]CAA6694141.1 COG2907: Amine oxidase, flavin-containing [Lentimonas sp. CC19]CAA6694362.1 COG2907: Amine oxidase, flavin-containing [Lentimonas sp. CC10]CAA7070365.1 COG2907: Amine oxidase, flavin-containing [Lentimonas sp. CC11]